MPCTLSGRSLLLALLLSNIFWLLVFLTFTQHEAPLSVSPITDVHLCPPCAHSESNDTSLVEDPDRILGSSSAEGSFSEGDLSDSEEEDESSSLLRHQRSLSGSGANERSVRAWSESWYNNGLLEAPSSVGLPRIRGPRGEQFPHLGGSSACEAAESEVVAYGFDAPDSSVVGILWPRNSRYRQMIIKHGLLGMAVLNGDGEEVATVVAVIPSEEERGSVNLLLRFALATEAGCEALIGVVEQPYPSWVVDFSYGFTATLDDDSPDSTRQRLTQLSVSLRRQRIHDYNFVHMFNPYTPRCVSVACIVLRL